MTTESDDKHILDEIPIYLSGGLTAAERERFDAHVQTCPACSAALVDARTMDDALGTLFKTAAPAGDFEDRLIAGFRHKTTATTLHPMVRRAAIGVAASILLGGAGFAVNHKIARLEQTRIAFDSTPTDTANAVFRNPVRDADGEISHRNQGQNVLYGDGHVEDNDLVRQLGNKDDVNGLSAAPHDQLDSDFYTTNVDFGPEVMKALKRRVDPGGVRDLREQRTPDAINHPFTLADRNLTVKDATVSTGLLDTVRVPKREQELKSALSASNTIGGVDRRSTPTPDYAYANPNAFSGGTTVTSGKLDLNGDGIADASQFRLSQGAVNGVTYYAGVRVIDGSGSLGMASVTPPVDARAPMAPGASPPAVSPSFSEPGVVANAGLAVSAVQPSGVTAAPAHILANDLARKEYAGQTAQPPTGPVAGYRFQPNATRGDNNGTPININTARYSTLASLPAPVAVVAATPAPVPPADNKADTTAAPVTPPAPEENAVETRKIIRQGDMAFEVDSFDSAVMTIGKIVAEEGGFVSTTDSDKLANGKVRGTVVLRVPPDRLDTLVLKLRGIGDLKSQKITAQDITKQYTDMESELRAARAMEDRLLDIIKDGKGAVKDLLEAEKQLGVWREKIEQVEGEIRYDNNLISLSTLSVSLMERDIKSAAFSSINEQITMALETEKVEEAYTAAKDAIANAKGRIVQSELKQYEAGQFGATIPAQLPPDAADAVVGRLRQLDGRLANFQRQRSQSNQEGSAAPLDPAKVKREDVTLNFTIYNLANIQPRRTTSLTVAANNVEDAYAAILEQAAAAGAKVVSSNLNRPRPDQSTGSIQLQVPTDKADALLASMRGTSEIISQETTENPDTQNLTAAKRGFVVQIISLAALAPRRSTTLTVAAPDVDAAYRLVLDKVAAAGGRIVASGINRGSPEQTNAAISFQVPTDKADAILTDVRGAGDLMRQETGENLDLQNTTASKRGFALQIVALAGVAARQSEQLQVAAADVPAAFNAILDALRAADGRIIASQLDQGDPTKIGGIITFEIARPARLAIDTAIGQSGEIVARNLTRSQDTDNTVDSKVRVDLTLGSAAQLPAAESTTLGVEVADVTKSVDDLLAAANNAGGREIDKDISQDRNGRSIAHVIVEVPLDKADALATQVEEGGHRRVKQVSRNPQAPQGRLARGRLEVTFADASTSLGGEETAWDAVRHGLAVSGMGLRWSVQMIVIGFCFVVPWALLVWGLWKFLRRRKTQP